MNFLLQMIGRSQNFSLRPSGRQLLLTRAANLAAQGNTAGALKIYKNLTAENNSPITDTLILAHLHLSLQQNNEAADNFNLALDRLLIPATLDKFITDANHYLSTARYHRATKLLEKSAATLDILLAATAGLLLSVNSPDPTPLLPLAKLSDLLLHTLARTHLASNLANSLRLRHLREDLAPYAATPQSITALLTGELQHLQQTLLDHPNHAETQYRLALTARALGQLDLAATSFQTVLKIHPHHAQSATRLAATLLQLNRPSTTPLSAAFTLTPFDLTRYLLLAQSATTPATFDQTVSHLCKTSPAPDTIKPNLAFALSQLSLLTPAITPWREPIPASF